jgi:archaellum component FlaF (FlaF/FlaG flagellin family)
MGAASVSVAIDLTEPTVRMVSPANYGAVDGVTTMTIDGSADLAKVQFLGKTIDTTVGAAPWSTTVDFSQEKPGWFSIWTEMRDRAGNRGVAENWVWVDHDIPIIKLDEANFPKILHGPIAFHVDADDTSLTNFDLIIDGKVVSSSGFNWRHLPWPGSEKLTGTFDLTFKATDEAGHTSEVTRTVQVDNTMPKIAAVAPASKTLVRRTFTATASGVTDASGIAKVELWVDGQFAARDTSAPYRFPVKTSTRNGPLQLEWIAYDAAGNTGSVYRRVNADNKAPAVSITKAPKHKAKVKGKVTVRVAAKDTYGIARVELLVNGKVVATDKSAAYALTVNTGKLAKTMKVRVRAYDKAGNVTVTSSRTWYRG